MIIRFFKYLSISLIVFTQSSKTFSQEVTAPKKRENISLAIGNLCQYIGKYQTNKNGDKNLCEFRPHIGINYTHKINQKISLYPQFHFNIPQNSRDKSSLKFNFATLVNIKFAPHKTLPLSYIAGAGLYFTNFIGKGGSVTLNNGQDQESFPRPKEYKMSYQPIINVGANYRINKKFSTETFLYTFNLFDGKKRAFSLGLNVNYHFGTI